jgi:hypothetical protein
LAPLHALHLVDLGAVDIEVRDVLRAGRELRGIARPTRSSKARADGDQEIAVVRRRSWRTPAVHARACASKVVGGRSDGADAHERGDHRDVEFPRELAQLPRGIAS